MSHLLDLVHSDPGLQFQKRLMHLLKRISVNLKLTFSTMVLGCLYFSNEGNKVLVFGGQDEQAKALKFINMLDLDKETVAEIPNQVDVGGCVVNEPIVVDGVGYSLFFKGSGSRTLAKWCTETNAWVVI